MHAKTVTTISVIVFLGLGFALALTSKIANPEYNRERKPRERGGTYTGTAGVVLQDRENTCGPAALKMILDRYGKPVKLQQLESTNHIVGGWSMQELKELADQYGLRSEGRRLDVKELSRIQLPVILFIESNHFVVVDNVDSAGLFTLLDPAIGRMKVEGRALARIWRGETLVFANGCNTKEKP